MAKIKMYKPGQLLTINGKVYRVKRVKRDEWPCQVCDAWNECWDTMVCMHTRSDCYLQLVTPKSSLG